MPFWCSKLYGWEDKLMSVLNILFVGSDEIARSIAKKSDSRDVDNYIYKDLKEGGLFSTISILRPNNYPDKPKPFFTSLTVSDFGIIEVSKVDSSFGEVIVSMASAGIKDGLVIINPSEGESKLTPIVQSLQENKDPNASKWHY